MLDIASDCLGERAWPHTPASTAIHLHHCSSSDHTHRAPIGLIRRDRDIRIFGYFSSFMHARNISERDFQTIHLKIITPKKAFLGVMI
eukprot:COSAG05_NODE_624_length_8276_cov_4.903265_2_plen_88_part_00